MSDIRFTMLGIVLIFAGFLILGIFGSQYMDASIQAQEFVDCFDYNEKTPLPIDCNVLLQEKSLLIAVVVGLITVGIISLIKGARGKWDQDVKPQDMLGPGNPQNP